MGSDANLYWPCPFSDLLINAHLKEFIRAKATACKDNSIVEFFIGSEGKEIQKYI